MARQDLAAASGVIPQTGFKTIFSTHGTKWRGLTVEAERQYTPDRPFTFEASVPHLSSVVGATKISWSARGQHHKGLWRPGTTIFLKNGYRLDNLYTQSCLNIGVKLENEKVSELWQDEPRPSSEDLLEHVIGSDETASGLLHAMMADARAGNPGGDLFAQSISVAMLVHVFDRYDRSRSLGRRVGGLSPRQMQLIKTYISEHIGDDLSVAFLSGLLRMSSAYFCKAFSRSFGVTPHRFIVNERVTIARQRLQNASAPSLAVLATGLGFANQAHFSNVFRKHVGCSPSAYRRKVE